MRQPSGLYLLRGAEFKINDCITIRHPTLDDIYNFDEDKYYSVATALTCSPSMYKVALWDNFNIDYEEISDFHFFYLMCKSLTPEDTSILLGDLDLSKFEIVQNTQTGDDVLYNSENGAVIDMLIYTLMTDFIRKINCFEKVVDKTGNVDTKKYLIDKERRRLQYQKNQPKKSMLLPLVSAMVNCEQFKYDHKTVWELPIYAFHDSVRRIQKNKNYGQVMSGVYAGTLDIKNINHEDLHWLT